jgi:hypothetical protein
MTTNVTVEAHCAETKEVRISIDNGNTGETIVIQNGEKWQGAVYDLKAVTVREVNKSE